MLLLHGKATHAQEIINYVCTSVEKHENQGCYLPLFLNFINQFLIKPNYQ